MGMRKVLVAVAVAAVVQAAGWLWAQNSANPPDVEDLMESVSFDPVTPGDDPSKPDFSLKVSQIDSDLELISNYTKSIRTYRSTDGAEMIPAMAARYGLNVTVGAWVDLGFPDETPEQKAKRDAKNKREIDTAVQLARNNRNVKAVIVGNESLYRLKGTSDAVKRTAVEDLAGMIRSVKKRVKVPVTTGEIWNLWFEYNALAERLNKHLKPDEKKVPDLIKEVDFLAVHILPFWEGLPNDNALNFTWSKYGDFRRQFPGKRVVIAEFGWPSQGYNREAAQPGQVQQAQIVRQFLTEARARGVEYNVVEAFDQQWKGLHEGSVGAYWGLFDAQRTPKFPLFGPVQETNTRTLALVGGAIGALIAVVGLWGRRVRLAEAGFYALASTGVGAGIAAAGAYPFVTYMNFGAWVMWTSGFTLMLILCVITMAKVREIAAVLFGATPRRLIGNLAPPAVAGYAPKVSIHIPAYREPAEMLQQTLDSCMALDYPNFEVVLVINNTPEEHYWGPVAAHCQALNQALGERIKFLNVPKLSGFKAGALNVALDATAPDAEIIAVIDADYVVHKDWLKDLVPYFADAKVGLVQAPQDHRDGQQTLLKTMMNSEYAGFFDIGMVQRNEDNAIVQHGTMCMVRRVALNNVGGWKHDTIVEDTELGLRLFEAGWLAHYTNRRYGWGLLPDTFKAFKTQRHRWAYGAVQIIKKHWRHMLPSSRTLTPAQKRGFVSGWFFWLSDAMGAFAAAMGLLWVPAVLFVGVLIPTVALSLPILLAFLVNVLHCALLYRHRVRETGLKILGAAVAAMSLQWTVAKAVFEGFVKDGLPFMRTDKGGNAKKKSNSAARWETGFGIALAAASFVLMYMNTFGTGLSGQSVAWLKSLNLPGLPAGDGIISFLLQKPLRIVELNVFAAVLAVQSVPFLAAAAMRGIERAGEWQRARAPKPVLAPAAEAPATVPASAA